MHICSMCHTLKLRIANLNMTTPCSYIYILHPNLITSLFYRFHYELHIYLGTEGVYIWATSGRGCVLTLSCVFLSFIPKMLVLCKIANETDETTVCDCIPNRHESATLTMCDARTQQNRPCLVVATASVSQCKGVMCTVKTQTRQRPIKDLADGG